MHRIKYSLALLFALLLVGMSSLAAFAESPHFVRANAQLNSDNSLTVNFKLAGLGNNQTIEIDATADTTAQFACQNNAGNFPNAANKKTVTGPETVTGTFTSGKNGQISASLTISPPQAPDFCPPGQTAVLTKVTYTNVMVTVPSLGLSQSVPGSPFSSGCLFPEICDSDA